MMTKSHAISYFGTATIRDSIYSDSGMKSSFDTISARERTAKLPLRTSRIRTPENCAIGFREYKRFLPLHLYERPFCEVVRIQLRFHDIINGIHFLGTTF